jgi:polyhydroxyalkanoate synthesis regulator phasin
MKEVIKKSFLLGLGAATMTKNQAEKMVKDLIKRNAVTIKDGKQLLNRVKKQAVRESSRMKKLAGTNAKKVAGKVGYASTMPLKTVKGKLKSLDKQLSKAGKKTLKKIMRDIR